MGLIKKGVINLLLVVLAIGLSLLVLEGVLRVYNPFMFRVKFDRIELLKNIRFETKNKEIKKLDKIIVHSKNSLGFRGAPPPSDFAHWLTILAIGGSTTECFYVSDGKTWIDILGRKLSGDFPRLWINNAGLDGHSTYGHLQLLQDYIIKLHPNYALFLVGINDVGRDDLTIQEKRQDGLDIIQKKHTLFHRIANRSEVITLLVNLTRYLKGYNRGLVHQEISLKDQDKLDWVDPQVVANIKKEYREKYLKAYEERLKQLVLICRQNGISPILITQPALYGNQVDVVTNVNLATVKVGPYNGKLQWELLEMYNDVTRMVGAEENVPVIDLARKMPKNSNYFYDYFHFTNAGSQKVAEIIYQDLSPILSLKEKERLLPKVN